MRIAVALAFGLTVVVCRAERVWVAAGLAQELTPLMIRASTVNLADGEALGDFLVPIIAIEQPEAKLESAAVFTVNVPRAGAYRFWTRMRSPGGQVEAFDIVTEKDGQHEVIGLCTGQPQDGRGWQWRPLREGQTLTDPPASVARLNLPAGQWRFRLRAHRTSGTVFAPLKWRQAQPVFNPRVDAFCLTDEMDYSPTDADAQRAPGLKKTKPPELRVTPTKLAPLPADGPLVENRKRLPDWMRVPRWFTKDSWRDELQHRRAGDIAALVREVAANGGETLRLSVFWGGEVYYPSRIAPHAPSLGRLDYLREAMDEAARTGVKIVVYMNPNALYPGHPLFGECLVREADGQASKRPAYGAGFAGGSAYPCMNHPRYRQFLRDVLTEMFTSYSPAGLYVDGLTPHLCFCEHCRAKWRSMFGSEMPVEKLGQLPAGWAVWAEFGRDPQPVGDVENDPDARRLTELLLRSFVEVTHEFSRTVKAARPGAITAFHSHPKPGTDDDYDGTLTEVYAPRPWTHVAWRSGELAGYSAVYRVPVIFNVYPHQHFTAAEARYHALQGLANGAYPNFWSTPGMKPVGDYMARCADYLDFGTAAPVKFLALPRDIREADTQQKAARAEGVSYGSRDRFLAPYVGAYSALMRGGLPVVTLHRPHFEEQLSGFKVLMLANVGLMSDAQAEAVRRFVREGGGLIATHETSLLDEKGCRRPDFALADVLGVHYRTTLKTAPRQARLHGDHPLIGGLKAEQLTSLGEPLISVEPSGAEVLGEFTGRPDLTNDVPALLVHRHGKGRVVYLPGRFDSMQCYQPSPAVERLFANAVRWAAPDGLPVEVEAPGVVGVTLFRQPQRLIVHLVNHERDSLFRTDTFAPLSNVSLRLALPFDTRVRSVRRLWENRELPFVVKGSSLSVAVGTLDEYEAVAVELEGRRL